MIWPCLSRSCSNSFYGNDLQEKSYICICLYWSCISFKFYSNRLAIKDKYWKSPVWKIWRRAPNPFSFSSCSTPVSTGISSKAIVSFRGLSQSQHGHTEHLELFSSSLLLKQKGAWYHWHLPVTHWTPELLRCKCPTAVPIGDPSHRCQQ